MLKKDYISAEKLLDDAFRLGVSIIESGYRPDCIVGVWRGGTPIAIAVQELMEYCGFKTDHIAIRTSYYTGIDKHSEEVAVHGLEYITSRIKADQSILIIDDVFDTGMSMQQTVFELDRKYQGDSPEVKLAAPYFKPKNNQTKLKPDYYLYETDNWLVFPHELQGLSLEEILTQKPGADSIKHLLVGD